MTRLVTSLGTLIALLAIAPAAEAGSYAFSIAGHRFQVEAPRNTSTPSGTAKGTPRMAAPIAIPSASVAATRTVARTYDVSVTQPRRAVVTSITERPASPA